MRNFLQSVSCITDVNVKNMKLSIIFVWCYYFLLLSITSNDIWEFIFNLTPSCCHTGYKTFSWCFSLYIKSSLLIDFLKDKLLRVRLYNKIYVELKGRGVEIAISFAMTLLYTIFSLPHSYRDLNRRPRLALKLCWRVQVVHPICVFQE